MQIPLRLLHVCLQHGSLQLNSALKYVSFRQEIADGVTESPASFTVLSDFQEFLLETRAKTAAAAFSQYISYYS